MKDALLARERKAMREAAKAERMRVAEHVKRYLKTQAERFAREEAANAPPMRCECCGVTGPSLDLDDGACLLCREKADAWG